MTLFSLERSGLGMGESHLLNMILIFYERYTYRFSLAKHPKLIETCRQKGIAVEVCPISYVLRCLPASFLISKIKGMKCWYVDSSLEKFETRLSCMCAQRLTSSMLMHPLPVLLNNGVPVALSCDDPSVFGNMGLTFDFFQVRIVCG